MIILQEIQTNGESVTLLPPVVYSDRLAADSAFHAVLSAAAVSPVNYHTVMMYDELGNIIRKEYYEHPTVVQPVVHQEPEYVEE